MIIWACLEFLLNYDLSQLFILVLLLSIYCRYSAWRHVFHMNGKADANQILFESTPSIEPRQPHSTWIKNITDDLSSFDMGQLETRDAQNQWSWRCWLLYSTSLSWVASSLTIQDNLRSRTSCRFPRDFWIFVLGTEGHGLYSFDMGMLETRDAAWN